MTTRRLPMQYAALFALIAVLVPGLPAEAQRIRGPNRARRDLEVPAVEGARAVVEAVETWYASISHGDREALLKLLDQEVVALPPDEPALVGKGQVWHRLTSGGSLGLGVLGARGWQVRSLAFTVQQVDVTGDRAVARVAESAEVGNGDEPMQLAGKSLFLLERREDGAWQVIYQMFNFDQPVPAPPGSSPPPPLERESPP